MRNKLRSRAFTPQNTHTKQSAPKEHQETKQKTEHRTETKTINTKTETKQEQIYGLSAVEVALIT